MKKHFSLYGPIEEIKILKRSDGKNVGCAFLEFGNVQSAAKAIYHANLQPLLGRPIVVDWAIPKNKFVQNDSTKVQEGEVKVKVEKESDTEDTDNTKLNSNGEMDG